MPAAARWPLEVHLAPRRDVPDFVALVLCSVPSAAVVAQAGSPAGPVPVERLAARCSHLELYQSEEDLRWARRLRLARKGRSHLLGNGTDLGRFDPAQVPPERVAALRRELGLPADALVVGAVGRLVAEKGYRELFAAARAVRQADPRVRFVAVGAPDLEKARKRWPGRPATCWSPAGATTSATCWR